MKKLKTLVSAVLSISILFSVSFAEFDTCEEYHKGKILTSEAQGWYNDSGCNESGNFYKYVFIQINI